MTQRSYTSEYRANAVKLAKEIGLCTKQVESGIIKQKLEIKMALDEVKCPVCGSIKISKYGKSKTGEQRYLCGNVNCEIKTFRLEYRYEGSKPGVDEKVVAMAVNGSGIRDTARVLKITTDKVMSVLKKLNHSFRR